LSPLTDAPFLATKAAVACAAAVGIVHWLHVPDALSAGFVAVACTSPTAYAGIRRGLEQVGGSAVGGLLATAALLALPSPALAPLACGLAVGLAVLACRWLRMPTGHVVAGLTVVYVVTLPHRSATEAVGVHLAKTVLVLRADEAARSRVAEIARGLCGGDAPPAGTTQALALELRIGEEPAPLSGALRD
jgi:hypothetical protein